MSEVRLHVEDDPERVVGELLAEAAVKGKTIVVTGGHAVGEAYALAAELAPDWSRASVWWSDDRCVPPDDELSNYGLVKRTLLDRLERQPEVHRIRGELPPEEAADAYDEELAGVTLDLMLLGLGPDGHIASLFADSPQLDERERLATSGPAGMEPYVNRVTLTLPALFSAKEILFLIAGADKADAVERAFRGPVSEAVPGSLLRTGEAPIDVYLDAAAASEALTH